MYVALALLTFCTVFAAAAGVREALATTTQALRATLAGAAPLAKTITVSATWNAVSSALAAARPAGQPQASLTEAQLAEITRQLHAGFGRGPVRLGPGAADWESLTSPLALAQEPLPGTGPATVKLEVTYRSPLRRHMRLVAGHFPAPPAPAPAPPPASRSAGPAVTGPGAGTLPVVALLQVVVTARTAAALGLRVGSRVPVGGPVISQTGRSVPVTFLVSGIVTPTDPGSGFWTADATVVTATEQGPPQNPYWVGGMIAGPGEAAALQRDFGPAGLTLAWGFPLALGSVTGQQARPLADALSSLGTQAPRLAGDVAPVAATQTVSANLLPVLAAFLATERAVGALLWLLYVSLTAAGLVVLALAARMVALRRSAELALLRARGASLRQVALGTARDAALTCVPAAAAAVGLAVLAVPGAGQAPWAGAAWPPAAAAAVAIGGPALAAAWQHRLPRRRAAGRRRPGGQVRLVAEAALAAAAIGGIVVFRQQAAADAQSGAGVNLYAGAAPLLVAVPAVIVMARVYPLVLRWLLRASARAPGAPAFLGLARAARTALTPALPAFALVLGLTVAAFAGMTRQAVASGDVAASWQAAGVDVRIAPPPGSGPGFTIPAGAARAIAAVPGVTHAALAWPQTWFTPDGAPVTALAVDPASYAALVAATHGYPPAPAGLLAAPAAAAAAQPVLASPAAAASLGAGGVTLATQGPVRPIRVRVARVVSGTPGWPGGGAFIVVPFTALRPAAAPPAPIPVSELLLTGAGIDRARLAAVLHRVLPGGTATFRSDVLAGLTGAPLQHGALVLLGLALAVAVLLGVAVMLLEIALGAAGREAALARLAAMGLGTRQRAVVAALEVVPALIAAAAAAWASALALPPAVGPAIDLAVFTGSAARVPLVPDIASVALPLAALAAFAALGLGLEIRSRRWRHVAAALRAGE